MDIKSIMTRPVATVTRKATVKEAVKKLAEKNLSCVVVTEKKMPIGIFTKFDLISFLDSGQDMNATAIETVMHTPVMPIEETDDLFSAARQMEQFDVRRFIIVDAQNRLTGIVTNSDIIKAFAQRAFPYNHSLAALAQPGLTVTPKTPLKKIVRMMVEHRASCAVILKNNKPAGIITDGIITKLAAKSAKPLAGSAETKMMKKYTVAGNNASLRETVINMVKMASREIVVTGADGRYFGVISQRDLVRFIEKSQI